MAIRVIFYTPSDDFRSEMTTSDAREWLRSRGFTVSLVTAAAGTSLPGSKLDDLDEAELAKWVAAVTLSEVRAKAAAAGHFNVRLRQGEWVAIRAEVIEAVGAESTRSEDEEPSDSEGELEAPFDPFLDWQAYPDDVVH